MRRAVLAVAVVVGVFMIGRAVAEPFVIDLTDPATYRQDWGGPHLIGVLAVHCGPGVLFAAAALIGVLRHAPNERAPG